MPASNSFPDFFGFVKPFIDKKHQNAAKHQHQRHDKNNFEQSIDIIA